MMKRKSGVLALLGLLGLAGACLDTTEPVEAIIWQGSLQVVPGAAMALSGAVAMVAEESLTQIAVGVEGGDPGARLGWTVREGSCDATGAQVGPSLAFPELVLGESGDGDTATVLFRRVPDAEVYAGVVLSGTEAGSKPLACADLIRQR